MDIFRSLRAGAGVVPTKDQIVAAGSSGDLPKSEVSFLLKHAGRNVRDLTIIHQERIGRLGSTLRARGIKKQEKLVHELIGELSAPGADARLQAHENVRKVVMEWWPKHWPFVDLCLAAWNTLCLKDVTPAIALVTIGPTGGGKSTVLGMFESACLARPDLIMFANEISAASILSAYGDASAVELNSRAMYKRTKHKLLVTSDMVNLLRSGDTTALRHKFGRLAQWLDGRGMLIESGTHGTLGEKGDFRFVWLGATTMLDENAWRTMAQLGARFLFYPCPHLTAADRLPNAAYSVAIRECSDAILNYANAVFPKDVNRIGTLPWPTISPRLSTITDQFAERIAAAQTVSRMGELTERPDQNHFAYRLALLLHGRALAHERSEVTDDDLRAITPVASRSAPGVRSKILIAMYAGAETTKEIGIAIDKHPTNVLPALARLETIGVIKQAGNRVTNISGPDPVRWKYITADEAASVRDELNTPQRHEDSLWEEVQKNLLNVGIPERGSRPVVSEVSREVGVNPIKETPQS